jgi:hypothetical protein
MAISEFERVCKEEVVAQFEVLPLSLAGWTEKITETFVRVAGLWAEI